MIRTDQAWDILGNTYSRKRELRYRERGELGVLQDLREGSVCGVLEQTEDSRFRVRRAKL